MCLQYLNFCACWRLTVEVDGSRAVGVDLSDDAVEVVGTELVVEGREDLPQRRRGDVAVALAVVQPEGLLELLLHRLRVLLLQEVGGDPAEGVEVHLSRTWKETNLLTTTCP